MAGRIPEDIIEKVRDGAAIEDVVGHFVPLKPKGTSFWGLCPFHQEKTPSFHVHPERQIFYCFGCGRGGNVFRFLMDRQGMSFPEAVEWCASRIGLDLARFLEDDGGRDAARARLFAATEWGTEWFAEQLQGPAGEEARKYMFGRGLRPETLEQFRLGWAPDGGGAFVAAARKAGLADEVLLQTSLLGRKEGRAPFAYFRSRLIFPVQGVAKKVYGFGGRILGPGEPKYLNSPETSIFQKRKILYALDGARARIIRLRRAVLVEGYMDALALHQAGWSEAVATCGTALTPDQVKQIGRFADRVVVLFDGDTAGRKAAYKAADVALTSGLDVRIASLPAGKDPADLLQAEDLETLQQTIDEAPGLVECLRREVESRGGRRDLKERALHHVKELVPRIPDKIRAELLLQEAAEAFRVPERLLRVSRPDADRAPAPDPDSREPDGPREELQRTLLRMALASRKARQLLLSATTVEGFPHPGMRRIFEALHDLPESVDRVRDGQLGGLEDDDERLVARLLIEMPEPGLDAASELSVALERLAEHDERERARKRRERMDEAYQAGRDWRQELQADGSPSKARPDDPHRGGNQPQ